MGNGTGQLERGEQRFQQTTTPPPWFSMPSPAFGAFPGKGGGAGQFLQQFLQRGMMGGFAPYGGQFTARQTPDQMGILSQLFAPGGGYESALSSLSDIAQQDALGRAEMLLKPSTERAMDSAQRRIRERLNVGNNLLSTGGQEIEATALSDILGQQGATLASLIPQLTQLRLSAAQSIPALASGAYGLAETTRSIDQSNLDALYREFLRTTPSGGPLQAMLQFYSAKRSGAPTAPTFMGDGGAGNDWTALLGAVLPLVGAFASNRGGSPGGVPISGPVSYDPSIWQSR